MNYSCLAVLFLMWLLENLKTCVALILFPLDSLGPEWGEQNYHTQAKSRPPPVFVNKLLLAHGHVHLFTSDLQLQSCRVTTESIWITELEIFIVWLLTENIC